MFLYLFFSTWMLTACHSMTCDDHCALSGKLCEDRQLAHEHIENGKKYACRDSLGKEESALVIQNIAQVEGRWAQNRAIIAATVLGIILIPSIGFYRYMKKS